MQNTLCLLLNLHLFCFQPSRQNLKRRKRTKNVFFICKFQLSCQTCLICYKTVHSGFFFHQVRKCLWNFEINVKNIFFICKFREICYLCLFRCKRPQTPFSTKSENYWKKNKKIKIIFSYVNLKSAVFGSKFVDLHQGPEIHPVGSRGIGK